MILVIVEVARNIRNVIIPIELILKMKDKLKIGVAQTKVPFSIEEGENNILNFVKNAKENGIDVLGLPEDCICGLFKYLNNYNPLKFLSNVARQYNINLFGSNSTLEDGHYYGTGFYIDSTGKVVSKAHKILLTKPERETGFTSGNEIQVFNTKFGKMAVLICKDAFNRYSPMWFYELKKRGVEYVLVPSMSLKVDHNSINFWLHSMWLLARWFDMYIFAPQTIGKNYTPYPSFGNALIVERDKGFLEQGSEDKEELLMADISVRNTQEIKKDYQQKWDPVEMPNVKISEVVT